MTLDLDLSPSALAPPPPPPFAPVLGKIEARLRQAQQSHLGQPFNLVREMPLPANLSSYFIVNQGDPYAGSLLGADVCDLECELIAWLMALWQADRPEAYWGSVGASGTESNFWALYLAREALPDAIVVYARDAHYSIPKSARILRMPTQVVDCEPSGAMSPGSLKSVLSRLRSSQVIVAVTCGTPAKGAHDDIGAIMQVLEQSGFPEHRRYVHVDGALSALVLPFLADVPQTLRPSFRHGIDSISASGHKMIGTPMPCGVLLARRQHAERVASGSSYLRSHDTTFMGARNGHAVLALWARLFGHGIVGFRLDARRSVSRARSLAAALEEAGVPILLNRFSLTVVFPRPDDTIVNRYQLACSGDNAHAVVMPSVSERLLQQFAADYLDWWARS